jgi:hypothetical protein
VNPGTIIKNDAGGTFCSLTIEPFDYRGYVSFDKSNLYVFQRGNSAEVS